MTPAEHNIPTVVLAVPVQGCSRNLVPFALLRKGTGQVGDRGNPTITNSPPKPAPHVAACARWVSRSPHPKMARARVEEGPNISCTGGEVVGVCVVCCSHFAGHF